MEMIMLSKMFLKLNNFLTDERSVEEKIKSCKDGISNDRFVAIMTGILFLYTCICSLIFPTYIPTWLPLTESSWIGLRDSWLMYLTLTLLYTFFWFKGIINKNNLLKMLH